MDSEADVLRRAKSLDEDALAAIFDAYYPPIYRYLYHATGHRQTAEDLAAQVFHQLLAALHAGRGPDDHLKAWLFRVAANLVVDDHRRQKYRADAALEDDLEEPAPGLEARCECSFQTARLHAALATLTPKQQR